MKKFYWYGEYPFDITSRIFLNKTDKACVTCTGHYKPVSNDNIGLWLCPDNSWREYCVHEKLNGWIKYGKEVMIDIDNPKIIKLTTDEEVKKFLQTYEIDNPEYVCCKNSIASWNPTKKQLAEFEASWKGAEKKINWYNVFKDFFGYFITKEIDEKYFRGLHNVDTLFIWNDTVEMGGVV